jgi:hypothetical protein
MCRVNSYKANYRHSTVYTVYVEQYNIAKGKLQASTEENTY